MSTTLAILGPGALGLSFARHGAERGFRIRLAGRRAGHARERLEAAWDRWRGAGMDEACMDRITPCAGIQEALQGAEAVLEALPEDLAIKAQAWRDLDALASPDVLRWTGTSSLSIRALRMAAGMDPGLMGFHLFVPVRRMRVVELARETETPAPLLEHTARLAADLGLRAIPVLDQPGLAASRMALAQGLEAMRLLERGVASAADLDALMVLGYGHPVGPLELSDRVGLDLRLAIADQIHRETGDSRFEAPENLRALVGQGHLGRKTGQGFFPWDEQGSRR